MNTVSIQNIIDDCVKRSHEGTINFGLAVAKLSEAGVESYHADYRRSENIYYLPSGQTHIVKIHPPQVIIADAFDAIAVRAAIAGAQSGAIKYPEFMQRTMLAGCVGYIVWIAGRHVQYFGRRGEVHVERFPAK